MAKEFKHGSVGTELTQAEWEGEGSHVIDSQATGDIPYASSASQLTGLAIGSANDILRVSGGVPDWQATTFITALGTIATGVWEGTDVGVAHGGTGASTLTANGVLVGNGTSAITAVDMSTKGKILIGDGSGNPQMLAVGTNDHVLTADSGETTGVKWAAAAAAAAGSLTGSTLASGVTASSLTSVGTIATGVWQGTDVGVAYGGTGVSTLTANGVLIGNGTGAVTAVDQSTKGHILIGDGSGNPQMLAVGSNDQILVADSGETTGVKWAAAGTAAAGSLTGSTLASGVVTSSLTTVGTIGTGVWQGTDVGVAYGGTGVSTHTANGVLIGNGGSAVTAVDMSTKGHILIGDGSGNPQMLGVGSNDEVLVADSGETTGVKWAAAGGGAVSAVANGADDRVTTFSSSTALNGEANFTFSGSALQLTGTFTVGVNDTGHDVKFFGATDGAYMLWDEDVDDLVLAGASRLGVGGSPDYKIEIAGENEKLAFSGGGTQGIYFGDAGSDYAGYISYQHANDYFVVGANGANKFTVQGDGNATLVGSLTEGSDSRLKTNVNTVSGALAKVKQMRGVSYDRSDGGSSGYGLIAQELEALVSGLISTADSENEYKSIAYSGLTAFFIEAIKEIDTRVTALE